MIVDVSMYDCEEIGCGRKFESKEELLEHYQRRHINLFNKYKDFEEIQEVIDEPEIKALVDVNDSQMLSTTSLERIRVINEEMLGIGIKYAGLDEIEEVL
jgi:hypothetical protein